MKTLTISILIILSFALAACGGGKTEVVGTTWQWEAFQDTAGVNDVGVTLMELANPTNWNTD